MSTLDVVAPNPTELVAHSHLVGDSVDLLDALAADSFVWLDGPRGFVTSGVVATVAPADAAAYLRRMQLDAEPDVSAEAGPRAVGALPFAELGRFIIPADIVACGADGRVWRTTIAEPTPPLVQAAPPTGFSIGSCSDLAQWRAQIARALTSISAGSLDKVVLARAVTVEADRPWDRRAVLRGLRETQPACIVYADAGFVGASPELLVRKTGSDVLARPLAGTATDAAALYRSSKDQREHRFVVDAVVDALARHCTGIRVDGPRPLELADLSHLATNVTATVTGPATIIELVDALHPTPAVAGTPRALALDTIAALEAQPRGRYAGPCGWVDREGDGEFVVALRGAVIDGRHATLHAGAGIVQGSDPDAEWGETQQKLMPMLQALVRP